MKRVLLVLGTRPEAIKMAPLINEFKASKSFEVLVAVTGQHREMLDQVLDLFGIVPDYDLNIMAPDQDLFDVTSAILTGMRNVLKVSHPDIVLVHGDTATTISASLAAFYAQIDIGHIEAGLRTHNLISPWPEEGNRQLTSRLTRWHFAPTQRNRIDLLAEGIPDENIVVTGNTVIDAMHWVIDEVSSSIELQRTMQRALSLAGLGIDARNNRYVLVTGHRRENFGDGFQNICVALGDLAISHPSTHFVYPVHLNPNVQKPVNELLSGINNIHLIKPLRYEHFVWLMQNAYLVLTDSGGVQEEAPGLGKPVLVMRDTSERPEGIEAGTVKLVGTSKCKIISWVNMLLEDPILYGSMSKAINPYGDGKASKRIVKYIKDKL